jgi:hypothetical protein
MNFEHLGGRQEMMRLLGSSVFLCFSFAFLSLFVQWPALFGTAGVIPLEPGRLAAALASSVYDFTRSHPLEASAKALFDEHLGTDDVCRGEEAISTLLLTAAVTSAVCAVLAATVPGGPLPLLGIGVFSLVLTTVYAAMIKAGDVFMSFQWDLLLVEVGQLLGLLALLRAVSMQRCSALSVYAVRTTLFKLLFMSGVVKLQSHCPAWLDLTASYYHHATQCLPTPLAWHFFYGPGGLAVHKLSVAVVLYQQVFLSLLLLVPFDAGARFAAANTVVQQTMILLSGNYNFFNALTIALACASCAATSPRSTERWRKGRTVAVYTALAVVSMWGFLRLFTINLTPSKDVIEGLFDVTIGYKGTIPVAVRTVVDLMKLSLLGFLAKDVASTIGAVRRTPAHLPRAMVVLVVRMLVIAVTFIVVLALLEAHAEAMKQGLRDDSGDRIFTDRDLLGMPTALRHVPLPSVPLRWGGGLSTLRAIMRSYSYGLFRRMTGFSPDHPLRVARPEIVLEGRRLREDTNWHELQFYFKPGSIDVAPRWAAPHQPRVDWQMWFAALSPSHPPFWLVHLIFRILQGSQIVSEILRPESLAPLNGTVDELRALLYHYNFSEGTTKDVWWRREMVQQVLPAVQKDDPRLVRYLQQTGLLDSRGNDRRAHCSSPPSRVERIRKWMLSLIHC